MAANEGTGIDPKRMVGIFYALAAVALGFFLEKVIGLVLGYARVNDFAILGEDWTLSTLIGFAIAFGAAFAVWRHPRAHQVSMEVANELKKVTWPTLRETRAATVAVIVATFVAAAILGVFDYVWARLSSLVY